MATIISLFNNKGGVSKTTTCFNLGWMLAEQGQRVIMVDADPQCNLTGMVLDLTSEDALEQFYRDNPQRNLKEALEPAFKSRPRPLEAVNCIEVPGRDGLFLIPGHVALSEDETSLGIAQQLSESLQGLRNLPGSFLHLFNITAEKYAADIILLDLSPGLGAINQNLVATSDYFIVPCTPDVFSVMAIESLARILPRWNDWANRASQLEALMHADYPFRAPHPKFLGAIIQRFRLKSGKATIAFQRYFDKLNNSVDNILVPSLEAAGMMLDRDAYRAAGLNENFELAQISDFNTLIAISQEKRKPVYALTESDVAGGKVWLNTEPNIIKFRETFRELANRVITLTRESV